MMGIYAYFDKKDNSVVYVGKDSNIDKGVRRRAHMKPSKYDAQRFNRVLQNNPNRYQYKEIFVFDEISNIELNHLEMQQIALFNPKFNFTKGGDGFDSGKDHPLYGTHRSDETKRKISESHKGERNPMYGRRGVDSPNYGRVFSKEHKQKLSEAHKGKNLSEEHKKKISHSLVLSKNNTGYFRVCKCNSKNCKQGFNWVYHYYEDGKRKSITSVDFDKLEEKVKAKGLEWYKLDEVLE